MTVGEELAVNTHELLPDVRGKPPICPPRRSKTKSELSLKQTDRTIVRVKHSRGVAEYMWPLMPNHAPSFLWTTGDVESLRLPQDYGVFSVWNVPTTGEQAVRQGTRRILSQERSPSQRTQWLPGPQVFRPPMATMQAEICEGPSIERSFSFVAR